MSSGKISAMINFTSGYYNIFNSCKAAGINEIITSRLFIETANLEPLIKLICNSITIIYLEDIKADITIIDKFIGYLFMRYPIIDINPNNCAAILFYFWIRRENRKASRYPITIFSLMQRKYPHKFTLIIMILL